VPELPEVEYGRLVADSVARGRVIAGVRCAADPIVFDRVSPARMKKALLGARVQAVHRRGKQIWMELDRSPHPLFHFGMTGAFLIPGGQPLTLASSPTRTESTWPPRFTKIRLTFDDGGELAMTNKRRLGRIRLRDDPEHEPPICKLGFDPLDEMPSASRFASRLAQRSGNIKGVLLDQGFAAGVGNWIADEVLFQAAIDPRRSISSLSADEIQRIRAKLGAIIRTAVKVNADKNRLPDWWLFHRRWGKDTTAVTREGDAIEHLTIAGRTTAWVPGVQG